MSGSTSRTTLNGLRERVLRQLQRLMELNADIDRNKSDSTFLRNNTEIKYVFDENIFEMFVRSFEHPDYVTAFPPAPRAPDGTRPGEQSAARQSAVITSEYLFSGSLPGQRDQRIYMTEWHFWELWDRMERQRQNMSDQVRTNSEAFMQIRAPMKALLELKGETRLEPLLRLADRQVADDAAELRRFGWKDDALCRFVFTSQAARLIASDETTEPVLQLDRIFSDEIAPRLRPLHLDYPLDAEAKRQLPDDTRAWMGRLLEERALRRARRTGEERGQGSLANDARSLAYIQSVARGRGQTGPRLVFVTGDHLLFDAYRRWHIRQARSEPFVLRRPLQFAPFINFNDTPNDVGGARFLFDRTREAVELPLIAFNLGMPSETSSHPLTDPPPQAAAQREGLLLQLMQPGDLLANPAIAFFRDRLDDAWLQTQMSATRELRDAWLRLERVAIGANHLLVSRRLEQMQQAFAEIEVEPGAANIGDAVITYVQQLLDRIVANSIRVWFPLAVDFIRTAASPARQGRPSRVPIALRLTLKTDAGTQSDAVEIDGLLDRWAAGDEAAVKLLHPEQNPSLLLYQHVVFAIAAVISLRNAQWSQASRYADLASAAANLLPGDATDEAKQADAAECDYLKALALRFRLGSFSPYRTSVTEDVWNRWVASGVDILERCEAYHHAPSAGSRRHILRELRAISERAALRLFYATWIAAPNGEKLPPFVTPETAFRHLRGAFHDLRCCAAIHDEVLRGEPLDAQRAAFFDRLQRQYIPNSAAAEFLAHLFRTRFGLDVDEELLGQGGPIMERIEVWADPSQAGQLPSVAQVDVFAFLAVRRASAAAVQWLRKFESENKQGSALAIDQALLSTINVAVQTAATA
jgi:hypothetical protein